MPQHPTLPNQTPPHPNPVTPGRPGLPQATHLRLGFQGEHIAAQHLEACGYEIIDRNWRSRTGELDLIARDGDTLVAVEVKTRSSTVCGSPLEAITRRKSLRLRRLLYEWARTHDHPARDLRIDAIGVTFRAGEPRIDHLAGIS